MSHDLGRMEGKAYGYLSRLFKAVAPQCESLPVLTGVCTENFVWSPAVEAALDAAAQAELDFLRSLLPVQP